jgi:hypothetical protein
MNTRAVLTLAPILALASGCASSSNSGCRCDPCLCNQNAAARVVAPASDAHKAAMLGRIKALAGTWEMTDDKGQSQIASIFVVSSDGHVVREIMFPGSQHEMTNMYHMDGDTLIVTHYCAVGNQPRMRAPATDASADRITFVFDSVTNKTSADQTCMGNMTIVFVDAQTIRQEWRSTKADGASEDHADFTLTRKKS